MNPAVVVGNGPSVLGRKLGATIDSHGFVVRCNNFKLEGFEEDLGSKCDMWATTLYHDIRRARLTDLKVSEMFIPFNELPVSPGWRKSQAIMEAVCRDTGATMRFPSDDQIRTMVGELQAKASTGLTCLAHCIDRFGSVAATGFDFFTNAAGHHYFGLKDTRPNGCPHVGAKEAEWFWRRVDQGIITPLEREDEGEILIAEYAEMHKARSYYGSGGTFHSKVIRWAKGRKLKRVLDFGCGKGKLVHRLRKNAVDADGYDPAIPKWAAKPKGCYDGVVCLDVMEHLPLSLVGPTLTEIDRLASRTVFMNISTRPAAYHLPSGRNCHETVRPADWWRRKIREFMPRFVVAHDHVNKDELLSVLIARQ